MNTKWFWVGVAAGAVGILLVEVIGLLLARNGGFGFPIW
jgi:ABC-type phosphate transport system auxiliary subunit